MFDLAKFQMNAHIQVQLLTEMHWFQIPRMRQKFSSIEKWRVVQTRSTATVQKNSSVIGSIVSQGVCPPQGLTTLPLILFSSQIGPI